MKKLALLFVANLLLAAYVFGADKQEIKYHCSSLLNANGTLVANAPSVSVRQVSIKPSVANTIEAKKFTLLMKPQRGRTYKIEMHEKVASPANKQSNSYFANVSGGQWILYTGQDHVLNLTFRGSNRSYTAQCFDVNTPSTDSLGSEAILAARSHAQKRIDSLIWVGAWIPRITSATISETQQSSANRLEYFIQIVLQYDGPTVHSRTWQYQVSAENNQIQNVILLNN